MLSKQNSQATYNLCQTESDLNRLLAADSTIKVSGNQIHFSGITCNYSVATNKISGADEQRFFRIRIEYVSSKVSISEVPIDDYLALLKAIRTVANSIGDCETIWDDVALHYGHLAYPITHRTENLMRKLINYFMTITIGKDWTVRMSIKELKDGTEGSSNRNRRPGNQLYQLDFITLKNILFSPYPNRQITDLYTQIASPSAPLTFSVDNLREFFPKSNWDRYFSTVVECEGAYIDRVWSELYQLRNYVAHNALITRQQFERIQTLADDISKHLRTAIEKIDQVHVPINAKDQVAENIAVNISITVSAFIEMWRTCESLVFSIAQALDTKPSAIIDAIEVLLQEEMIDTKVGKEILSIHALRNQLVHDAARPIPESDVKSGIDSLTAINALLQEVSHPPTLTWRDEISMALRSLGGQGTLREIYDRIQATTTRDLPENWKACIRYTIQLNSSDTETFQHGSGTDVFQRIGRGLWKLRTD